MRYHSVSSPKLGPVSSSDVPVNRWASPPDWVSVSNVPHSPAWRSASAM
jgi:hypothetical protein